MTSTTDPGNKSTAEIQRELEEERRRLRETGHALQDRLSVGTVIDEVLARTRDRGPDYAGSLGRTIRDNPIPVTLIGICLAWLMAGGQRASEEHFRHGRGYGRELDLDEEGGYPRPARRPAPPPPAGPAAMDPVDRPMAEPGPAGPLGDEPLREPPPAAGPAGPADPLGPGARPSGGLAASPPPEAPRPGALGTAGADDPLRPDTDETPSSVSGGTGTGAEEEPLRLRGDDPFSDDKEEEPLRLGEESRGEGFRSSTPPPASGPVGSQGSRPSWYTDSKDKP